MVEKDDWRLSNDVAYLKKAYINPIDGEEICKHAPHLKRYEFCLDPVQDNLHQHWFVPEDLSCCICEECYNDFLRRILRGKSWMAGILSGLSDARSAGRFFAQCQMRTIYINAQSTISCSAEI